MVSIEKKILFYTREGKADGNLKVGFLSLFLLTTTLLFIKIVDAGVFEKTIDDIKILLYGIAAGVAILLLIIHGIKLKTASSPREREEVKKAIIFVILGLILIIIAASLVELMYKIPSTPPTT